MLHIKIHGFCKYFDFLHEALRKIGLICKPSSTPNGLLPADPKKRAAGVGAFIISSFDLIYLIFRLVTPIDSEPILRPTARLDALMSSFKFS